MLSDNGLKSDEGAKLILIRLAIRTGKSILLLLNIRAAIFTLNDCCFNLRRAVKNDRRSRVAGVDGIARRMDRL